MGKFLSIDMMEKENAPPSSLQKLSLSLKRQFAVLEREDVDQYSLVKVPPNVRNRAKTGPRTILKSNGEITTEETLAARFMETY